MAVLVCVCGPSQAGKNTLISKYVREFGDECIRMPTATSRPPRKGEVHGVDKFFISETEFTHHPDHFFEHVIEHGNHYGIVKQTLIDFLKKYAVVFVDIEIRGMRSLLSQQQSLGCSIVCIFLTPSTFEEIERRIRKKGDANVHERIESARSEWLHKDDVVFTAVIDTSRSIEESYKDFRRVVNAHR